MDEYIKAQVEMIQQALKAGDKVSIEYSNEAIHFDPITGAKITTYTEDTREFIWPERLGGRGNVG